MLIGTPSTTEPQSYHRCSKEARCVATNDPHDSKGNVCPTRSTAILMCEQTSAQSKYSKDKYVQPINGWSCIWPYPTQPIVWQHVRVNCSHGTCTRSVVHSEHDFTFSECPGGPCGILCCRHLRKSLWPKWRPAPMLRPESSVGFIRELQGYYWTDNGCRQDGLPSGHSTD